MRLDREGRRTVAQFLNGLAVAVLATDVMAPLFGGGTPQVTIVGGLAVIGAILLHLIALTISVGR